MSEIRRRKEVPIITTGAQLRQSVIELRGIYSELSEEAFCAWYQEKYKVKSKDVQQILRSAKHE